MMEVSCDEVVIGRLMFIGAIRRSVWLGVFFFGPYLNGQDWKMFRGIVEYRKEAWSIVKEEGARAVYTW